MNYLAIQNNYDEVQLALMNRTEQIATSSIDKREASKELIVHLDQIFKQTTLSLSQLFFIVANQGPGPFTTLRVVITTVNGLAYATNLPLLGINALYAMAAEWYEPAYKTTAILFNAFGNDVYTLVIQNDQELLYGVYPIDVLLEELKNYTTPIRFLGNGVTLHQTLIRKTFSDNALIPQHIPAYCSLQQIARMGWERWQKDKTGTKELLPLYMKQHPAAI